jgi:hypothetical protein
MKHSGVDLSLSSTLDIHQIRLAYAWICAQLDNGNRDGRNIIRKHDVEAWAGYFIPRNAVDIAMYIAGISGLANKQIFPNIARLRGPKVGAHWDYSRTLSIHSHNRAEADPNGDKLTFRKALEQHRKLMAEKANNKGGEES